MTRTIFAALGATLALGACTGEPAAAPTVTATVMATTTATMPPVTVTATPTATPKPTATPTAAGSSGIPRPTDLQANNLLLALGKIDSGLKDERSIDRARNTCQSLLDGTPQATVRRNTKERFTGGSTPNLTEAQVRAIIAVIESNGFCVKG